MTQYARDVTGAEQLEIAAVQVGTSSDGKKMGAQAVALMQSTVTDAVFFDAVSATGDSSAFTVGGMKTLTVEFYGTSTSRTVQFFGVSASGSKVPLAGVNLSTFATGVSTTGTGEVWQFAVTGLVSVIFTLAAVAGGNVSAKGKAVA